MEVWNSKWVQKVLNRVAQRTDMDFQELIEVLKEILKYPGMWDEWNISKFIDVFYAIVKKYHSDDDNRMTMQQVWEKFWDLKTEQIMEKITLSTEFKIENILEWHGAYYHWNAYGLGWVWAISIWK